MSATITSLLPSTSGSAYAAGHACGRCGAEVPVSESASLADAQARIMELEAQISILTLRATSAVERATGYETQLKRLQIQSSSAPLSSDPSSQQQPQPSPPADQAQQPAPPSPPQTATSRFARLMGARYNGAAAPGPDQRPPSAGGPADSDASLRDQLTQEQTLRRAAESAAARTNNEIEELTAQLFEQANEMVAQERKARAKLESRVETLEKRDTDKARRLGLLETRVQRVERVRGLLEKPAA